VTGAAAGPGAPAGEPWSGPPDDDGARDGAQGSPRDAVPDGARDAAALLALLGAAGRTLAVAESLTGGAVADALVAVPGASASLRGAVVAYASDLKATLLDVPAELLARHGAVHPDVAAAMADGVRGRLGADYGLATTGVAGPDPQDGHRPGTVHVAVQGPWGGEVRTLDVDPSVGRAGIRAAAVRAVLALALRRAGDDLATER